MRIAICDDDMAVTGVMDGMLQKIEKEEKIEMEVDVFFGGAGLWEQIQQTGAYDLIYLDIEMEDMDGLTVARKIREKDPYTILIFVSAYDSYFRQLFEVEPFRFSGSISCWRISESAARTSGLLSGLKSESISCR